MEAQIFNNRELNKNEWDDFIQKSTQGSPFTLSWFMDIVESDWHAIILTNKNEWQAVMPIQLKSKFLMRYSLQPLFTKYWGILLRDTNFKNVYEEYHWKKKTVKKIIEEIPGNIRSFSYLFSPDFDYPMPFHWKKYEMHVRYTYIIDLSQPLIEIENNFKRTVSAYIRRSTRDNIAITEESNMQKMMVLLERNRQAGEDFAKEITDHKVIFEKILSESRSQGKQYCITSRDPDNNLLCGAIFLDFRDTRYYFLGLVDPKYRKSDHMNRIIYEGIRTAPSRIRYFDFFGSMIEGVETFIRSFGARPVPYLQISKTNLI
ncbi:MAG: hypothetical protein HYY40_04855 [Bacteroidetes bacterium]|nr:hypothetical protein [Bacteroidota bacterium]